MTWVTLIRTTRRSSDLDLNLAITGIIKEMEDRIKIDIEENEKDN